MHAFSESVKSKFSAASARYANEIILLCKFIYFVGVLRSFITSGRYKESISKSTQGLKEKLLAKKTPVKELGRGVQREMSAGIAGVARMFERLDPSLKRNSGETFKGKHTQDNVATMHL